MPYKLTQVQDDGTLLTGDAMMEYLAGIGFAVPVKEPLTTEPLPAPVYRSSFPVGDAGTIDYLRAKANRDSEFRRVYYANKTAREIYFKQFRDFAVELELIFEIATLVVTGEAPDGTKIREYRIIDPCAYSFQQCADKLMGAYGTPPPDALYFISYQYF